MKKLLSLLLTLAILLPAVALGEAAPALDADALPEVGDIIHGFEVLEVGTFPLVNADTVLFEHQKTGAQLFYLANDDTNRVFELAFRTPAESDMGTSHVFEHATLDGSEKYPSRTLFFNLIYQTYNTYINASTYNYMTIYPLASLSEAQLLRYADYYTDSCLHPVIMRDESIFREEAWRYCLSDADDELTIAGTVYSEMQGSYSKGNAAYYNFMKTMFPGSTKANISGDRPDAIPDLTWEDLKAYHDAYYHPSNSLACLYGSFEDYAAFLELLDGYYSEYEREEISSPTTPIRPSPSPSRRALTIPSRRARTRRTARSSITASSAPKRIPPKWTC